MGYTAGVSLLKMGYTGGVSLLKMRVTLPHLEIIVIVATLRPFVYARLHVLGSVWRALVLLRGELKVVNIFLRINHPGEKQRNQFGQEGAKLLVEPPHFFLRDAVPLLPEDFPDSRPEFTSVQGGEVVRVRRRHHHELGDGVELREDHVQLHLCEDHDGLTHAPAHLADGK
jgi:hypothetical protein